MDPISMGIGAVGSIASGLLNNVFAGQRQSEAQNFAREQAATAEANFRQNRQTAYQDTMADMRSAGLNPILAYQRGATGSTMGATPGVSAAPVSDVGIGSAVNSALAIRRQNQELQNMEATRQLTLAQKNTEDKRPANVEADTEQRTQLNKNLMLDYGLKLQDLEKALPELMVAKDQQKWIEENPVLFKAMVQAAFATGKTGEIFKPVVDIGRSLIGGATGNSAGSAIRNNPVAPPTNSSKNLGDVIGSGDRMPSPNDYRRNSPNFRPAPARPRGGWFDNRFYGVDQ